MFEKFIFYAVIFAPEKNLLIDTKKNSIYLKFAPVNTKNANVTINIIEALRFLFPWLSKFLITISLIFLSFGLINKNKSKNAISKNGINV